MSNVLNYFGAGSKLEGKIHLAGATKIDGCLDGELTTRSPLFIGERAELNAEINGTSIVIAGIVKGTITGTERIELRPTAKVNGSLTSPALVVNEGAYLEGYCSVNRMTALEREPGPSETGELGNAQVSFFITEKQKAQLRTRGYDDAEIGKMRPAEAHRLLGIV